MEALYYRKGDIGNPYDTFCNQLSVILLDNTGQIQFEFPNPNSLDLHLKIQIGAEIPKDISLVGSGTLQIMEILLNVHEQKREFNIILLEYHLQKTIHDALYAACNIHDLHKIMEKEDCGFVLKAVFNAFEIPFEMEGDRNQVTNFNDLLEIISLSTIYNDWEFILKI
jgi:hypothetical protein